jgi:hypothetical protein
MNVKNCLKSVYAGYVLFHLFECLVCLVYLQYACGYVFWKPLSSQLFCLVLNMLWVIYVFEVITLCVYSR